MAWVHDFEDSVLEACEMARSYVETNAWDPRFPLDPSDPESTEVVSSYIESQTRLPAVICDDIASQVLQEYIK